MKMDRTRRSARQRESTGGNNGAHSQQQHVRFRHLGRTVEGEDSRGSSRPQSASVSFKGVERGRDNYVEVKKQQQGVGGRRSRQVRREPPDTRVEI
jgi:hypothetical protein